jgi:hypothetical protein
MELSKHDAIEIFSALARIEARQEAFEKRLDTPGALCAVHIEQIREMKDDIGDVKKEIVIVYGKLSAVQTVIGKKEIIVAAFGAFGFGMMWAFKALVAWAGGKT